MLGAALALSCAVVAKNDPAPSPPSTVTSASSETPSVTIPLSQPTPAAVTTVEPAPAPIVPAPGELTKPDGKPKKKKEPKTESARSEAAKNEPAKIEPTKLEPAQGAAAKVESAKVEQAKVEPVDPEALGAKTALSSSPPPDSAAKPVTPKPAAKPKKPKPAPTLASERASDPIEEMPNGKPPVFRCFVRDVMAFYDRTHVRCYNKVRGDIAFFAVDTSQPIASTVLAKALNGMQMGKPITITFAPGSDLNPSNCDVKNCRRLLDVKN
jgi:hypothetical protein